MNPFQALAQGQFLPVIVFALLFGLAARTLLDRGEDPDSCRSITAMLHIFDAAQKTVFQIVGWVMRYFPIGIFALTATAFARYGLPLLQSYLQVALCVIIGILLMIFVCYPAMLFLLCKENPYRILWSLREPVLTAFVTRSSAAALPVSIRTATEKLHIRKEFSGFTLSLGATVNMDGVCIHLPAFAVLAANLFGLTLGPWQILFLVISVVFASVGAGGVPGGSIFLLFMVLQCLNLTPEQVSLIVALALGINPLLDMFETACNVAGDNVGTYAIGKKLKLIEKD
jgi:Na+/H+-dicarboxylate symporter